MAHGSGKIMGLIGRNRMSWSHGTSKLNIDYQGEAFAFAAFDQP